MGKAYKNTFRRTNMYTLYKNPIQLDTLYIVQFLYSVGIDLRPNTIIERNHPIEATELPSLYDQDEKKWYVGLHACVAYYENKSLIYDVLQKASEFKNKQSEFRCGSSYS